MAWVCSLRAYVLEAWRCCWEVVETKRNCLGHWGADFRRDWELWVSSQASKWLQKKKPDPWVTLWLLSSHVISPLTHICQPWHHLPFTMVCRCRGRAAGVSTMLIWNLHCQNCELNKSFLLEAPSLRDLIRVTGNRLTATNWCWILYQLDSRLLSAWSECLCFNYMGQFFHLERDWTGFDMILLWAKHCGLSRLVLFVAVICGLLLLWYLKAYRGIFHTAREHAEPCTNETFVVCLNKLW